MPHVAKIYIYPIKSLDGVEVTQALVLHSGALQYDRQYAIIDAQGKFVNAKRYAKIHLLRSKFDLKSQVVSLQIQGSTTEASFNLEREIPQLEAWLSDFFGFQIKLQKNLVTGFPDDTISPGPTIVSTATLKEVACWYSGLNEDDIRRRMRTTLEIDGVPAFWEDKLFSESEINFKVGNLQFVGVNPCQRCVVPTRNAVTGKVNSDFQKIFIHKRRETLPEWVDKSRFNHFYKLAVNTKLAKEEVGDKIIKVGDEIIL
ncbi:MOSC N-terminal beta barrel domain-containing protein [Plectonema cf. radiosum LEGE 06105]|uniref:MOSC N-terminal beta barrel domain-containing protein n=1 Tax=Plectonema cf. radiosum LEGE 06105 TaxID=945769 RepID=A0A8J7FE41_9CYAN|nr:MOSC N-terminal beta barrel domain-containing protein [Plectonema radiosum]MBE9214748.1 MOSC N-terminal beta barrel domain-containing protein [Plectonema cf. radiosum LEGE 06105]